jgi:hypothetical protein
MRTGRDGLVGDRAIRDAAGSAATPVADAEIGYREVSFVHLIGACNGGRYHVTFGKSVTIPHADPTGKWLAALAADARGRKRHKTAVRGRPPNVRYRG